LLFFLYTLVLFLSVFYFVLWLWASPISRVFVSHWRGAFPLLLVYIYIFIKKYMYLFFSCRSRVWIHEKEVGSTGKWRRLGEAVEVVLRQVRAEVGARRSVGRRCKHQAMKKPKRTKQKYIATVKWNTKWRWTVKRTLVSDWTVFSYWLKQSVLKSKSKIRIGKEKKEERRKKSCFEAAPSRIP